MKRATIKNEKLERREKMIGFDDTNRQTDTRHYREYYEMKKEKKNCGAKWYNLHKFPESFEVQNGGSEKNERMKCKMPLRQRNDSEIGVSNRLEWLWVSHFVASYP